jgi:hypothetical protein
VQVTVCAAMPQVQPVPEAFVGVRPAGTESVTVTTPEVETPPALVTVSA